jgi:hypothetical protein
VSGEAGADLTSTHYAIHRQRPHRERGDAAGGDGHDVGRYFEEHSRPYRRWLARAKKRLDALFVELVAEGESILCDTMAEPQPG